MLTLLLFIVLVTGSDEKQNRKSYIVCNGLIFHDVYYDKELLFQEFSKSNNLVIHKFSETLFFSHTVQNGTFIDFKITYCHLNEKKCHDVYGIPGGYAIAYDRGNDDMYFGGHDGIYKYNFLTNFAEFFTEKGKSIWGLFVKKNFYYIAYPTQTLFIYQGGEFVEVAEAIGIEVDNFFISKHSHIYFSNKTALYKLEKDSNDIIHLEDEIDVRQIVEDSYGDVYFVAKHGIYLEQKPILKIKKIAQIDDAYGLAFDEKERVIYSDKNAIYRLSPNKDSVCYDVLRNLDKEKIIKEAGALAYAEELLSAQDKTI